MPFKKGYGGAIRKSIPYKKASPGRMQALMKRKMMRIKPPATAKPEMTEKKPETTETET